MLLIVLFEIAVVCLFIAGIVLALRDWRMRRQHPNVLYMGLLTCFFLVLLRLSIGWHFLFEGVEKVKSASWSSEPYMREASGPLAPVFRAMAGDPLLDRVQVAELDEGQDPTQVPNYQRFPPRLARDWQRYYDTFIDYYHLDDSQRREAETRFLQTKEQTGLWLIKGMAKVKRESPYGPPVEVELTTPQRVQEYVKKVGEANELQEQSLTIFGPDVTAKLRAAKADVNKLRAELRRDLDEQTGFMKKSLYTVLTPDQIVKGVREVERAQMMVLPDIRKQEITSVLENRELLEKVDKEIAKKKEALKKLESEQAKVTEKKTLENEVKQLAASREQIEKDRDKEQKSEVLTAALSKVLRPEQLAQDPLEGKITPVLWGQMSRLERIDLITKWGLVAVGVCLLAGLFTRTACVAGAGFLLLFYLAMPSLPGLPENPKAEGHYLLINKNIIEMLALLTLATTRSGRWLGIDGVLQFLNPRRWQADEPRRQPQQGIMVGGAPTGATPVFAGSGVVVPAPREIPIAMQAQAAKEPGHGD